MFSNQGHGSRGGKWATRVPAGKCARGAGPKPGRPQGSEADSSPGSPRPAGRGQVRRRPHPPHPRPGAPRTAARLAEISSQQPPGCAASPRSERVLTHRGVLPPARGPVGSLRRVSGSQRERTRVNSGQVGRRLPVHARDSAAGARGPSEPTGGRASAWLQLSRRRSGAAPTGTQRAAQPAGARLSRGVAERGPLAAACGMAAPLGTRSSSGSSSLRKDMGNDRSKGAPSLAEKTLTLGPGQRRRRRIRKDALCVRNGHFQGTYRAGNGLPSSGFSDS
ncbi:collagen alpha-1(I) chain-like [Cebus imitator]|uniref:collagen alpha-1(I) chain-like n=1 Tax=Cebus imitator TaxID=2715852 RepID=UPI0018972256|nr:collagen alpha-1(I) chain-like [Cebus imitator]